MTPGYRIGHGLGGNIDGLSRAEVNRWRNTYVAERNRIGVAGFGEFHFVLENSRTVGHGRTRRAQSHSAWPASNPFEGRTRASRGRYGEHVSERSARERSPMTAMTATTLGTVMLVVGVLVLAWGFPNLPRR